MNIIQSIILGIIQGLTEFLPISSSGHLIVLPKIFGWQDQGLAFDIFLHLGTLLAVLFFFRRDWLKIFKAIIFRKRNEYKKNRKLALVIIIGIIPAVCLGFFLNDLIGNQLRLPLVVGINLIFWGIVLGIADWRTKKQKNAINNEKNISYSKVLIIGLFQAISLIPGGSRSGLSITGGLFAGLNRKTAVRFSFLMSAPLILGAGLFEGIKIFNGSTMNINWLNFFFGFFAALLSGILAIRLIIYLAERKSFMPFVIYRIILGILILLFLL